MIQDDRPAPPASYQALDLLCTLMTVLDEQGAVLFANAALENALGLSRRMLEGSELAACFTEPALLDKALRGAQDNDFAALRFEASLHRVGGDALPVHVTVSLAERPGHVLVEFWPLEQQARQDREERLREALVLITRLEPRPGRRFADVQRQIVVPDVIVRPVRSGAGRMDFSVQLNPDVMPKLRVHDIYASALRSHRGSEGHAALQQRLQEARWFIKNIQQRFDTILRVSQAIVERQKNFFVHGELAMRPLVLRDIADALGLHESTISRVTTAKYMATPQGTYELKYFFGSGLGTEAGGNASSTAVRALIKQFVAAEDPKKPLSDNQLADMLKEQGIECARRTVAKYRELLKIPPTTLRKAL